MVKGGLKVHKIENFLAPILNFELFHYWFCLNIKILYKKIFLMGPFGGDRIVPLSLRLRGIKFSLV